MSQKIRVSLLIMILAIASGCQKDDTINDRSSQLSGRVKHKRESVPVVPGDSLKSSAASSPGYSFFLVAEVDAPVVDDIIVQATHVDIAGSRAFVSYNVAGPIQKVMALT